MALRVHGSLTST